ncbi:tyrosine-type recombinase/integrase [Saccharothrix sp. AJ9571]|nr:tyrosine-type recombinase/integrase [Saccharothrix sp. AJ9571]
MATYTRSKTRARGSIDVLASGALRVRVFAGYDTVTKKRLYLTEIIPAGPDAETLAEKARVRLVHDVDERRHPRTTATLGQLIEKHIATAELDPGTRRLYQRDLRNHIQPRIGKISLASLDVHQLESFYAELRRCRAHCNGSAQVDHRTPREHTCDERCGPHRCQPLQASTVRSMHFLISGALSRGVRWKWVSVNAAQAAEPPPAPKPNPDPPTAADAARILNAAWQDPDWHAFLWLAMTSGARRGELCALRWKHVDLERGTLTVRYTIDQHGATLTEKLTKDHQRRQIALDLETVAVLEALRQRSLDTASKLGITLSLDAYIFSGLLSTTTPPQPDTCTQRYGRLVKRLNIATSLHKLRHYSATELISAGVDVRTVGGRFGHAGGGTTTLKVYAAWVAEADQRAAATLIGRMPERPTVPFDKVEHAKTDPRTPYEQVAADIRSRILARELLPGQPAPTQLDIRSQYEVSAGTANRAVGLLKKWHLISTSRGRRATVLGPPVNASISRSEAPPEPKLQDGPEGMADPDSDPLINAPKADTSTRPELHEVRLLELGSVVKVFTAQIDSSDANQLTRVLRGAIRRHRGPDADIDDFELEVRRTDSQELITTFATF